MEMTKERWQYTSDYLREVFGEQDEHLAHLMEDAVDAGLPNIAVSADVGRMLMMLTSMTKGRLALELGTLGGYSGIWIARGLKADGQLITIESEMKHFIFAQQQFDRAGVADRVDIRHGKALELLPAIAAEVGEKRVDVVFIDAIKLEYPEYWKYVRPLIAEGGLIIADNVLGSGSWWIDDEQSPERAAADTFSRLVADDADFEAFAVPLREGVLIGRRIK